MCSLPINTLASRAKVKRVLGPYVGWQSLPDGFPANILQDRIAGQAACERVHRPCEVKPELTFWPSGSEKYTSVSVRPSTIFSPRGSSAPNRLSRSPRNPLSPLREPDFPDTTSFGVFPGIAISSSPQSEALPCADRESRHPLQHRSEHPAGQMTPRQQQPKIAGMFYQPATRLHQPLLQARSLSPVRFLARIQPSWHWVPERIATHQSSQIYSALASEECGKPILTRQEERSLVFPCFRAGSR